MEINAITCPSCGAKIQVREGKVINFCEYCGTHIAVDDGIQRFEYIDRARFKEAENESIRLEEHRLEREKYQADLEKWRRLRNKWIIALFALMCIVGLTGSEGVIANIASSLCACVLLFGIPLWLIRPKDPNAADAATSGNRMGFASVQNGPGGYYYRPAPLPWYYQIGWIIVLGMFSGGIYWIAGPILRSIWKSKH